jgi:hypothetical protein
MGFAVRSATRKLRLRVRWSKGRTDLLGHLLLHRVFVLGRASFV